MRKSLQLMGCLAILAAPMLAVPVHAQNATPPVAGGAQPDAGTQWRQDHARMQQLRAQREEIQAEHDRLKMQCMDAKGQDLTDCQQKMKTLHAKQVALHQQMKALHDKRMAEGGPHPDWQEGGMQKGTWQASHQGAPASMSSSSSEPMTNPPLAPSQMPGQ
jgi:hypothetical protein